MVQHQDSTLALSPTSAAAAVVVVTVDLCNPFTNGIMLDKTLKNVGEQWISKIILIRGKHVKIKS